MKVKKYIHKVDTRTWYVASAYRVAWQLNKPLAVQVVGVSAFIYTELSPAGREDIPTATRTYIHFESDVLCQHVQMFYTKFVRTGDTGLRRQYIGDIGSFVGEPWT